MKAALCIASVVAACVACFLPAEPAFAQTGENVLALPPVEELIATRERPLFAVSRRPPPVIAAPRQADQARAPITLPFELTGIVGTDETRIALLHDKSTNEDIKVAPGSVTGDWKVESVADRFVILTASGRRVRLWLIDYKLPTGVDVRIVRETINSAEPAVPPASGAVEEIFPLSTVHPAAEGQLPDGSMPVRPPAKVVRARPAQRPKAQP